MIRSHKITYMRYLVIAVAVIVLDQLSKQLIEHWLTPYQPFTITPFFNLTLMYNTGAAFSFLSDAGGWQRWFFILLSSLVSLIIIGWLYKLSQHRDERWAALALSLILGGAIGNLIDRILFGKVIDFLYFYYQAFHWPTFNLADSAITVGAVLLAIDAIFRSRKL